jgi:hypothetical protein
MFYALHLWPFGPGLRVPERRQRRLQEILDEMEDRAFAHYTTGTFRHQRESLLRPIPPRPRRMTAEWLEWREYDAYDPGHHWNGWACPLMTREQLERLLPDHNATPGMAPEDPYLELRDDGVLISRYGTDGDEGETEIHPTDHGVGELLYDIGSLGLCWEWGEEQDDRCSCGSTEFTTVELLTSTVRVCARCGKEKS